MKLNPHAFIVNIFQTETPTVLDYTKRKRHDKEWEQLVLLTARRCLARQLIFYKPLTIGEVKKEIQKLF